MVHNGNDNGNRFKYCPLRIADRGTTTKVMNFDLRPSDKLKLKLILALALDIINEEFVQQAATDTMIQFVIDISLEKEVHHKIVPLSPHRSCSEQ